LSAPTRSRAVTALLLAPAGTFFFFLLILPLIVVVIYSFGERAAEGGYAPAFTLDNYLNLPARGKAFLNTLRWRRSPPCSPRCSPIRWPIFSL
jgi:spermidine/putrescine transport system permease protein